MTFIRGTIIKSESGARINYGVWNTVRNTLLGEQIDRLEFNFITAPAWRGRAATRRSLLVLAGTAAAAAGPPPLRPISAMCCRLDRLAAELASAELHPNRTRAPCPVGVRHDRRRVSRVVAADPSKRIRVRLAARISTLPLSGFPLPVHASIWFG